ncbi:LVIVD repeat-containing protein [Nocardioides acrostichi]|uniref:LVIVD repeat-containing protein n=1 Tax=Nocardioides acrostichi TaxID=2784339 RepID=A0A930YBF6_9ACTN|nr:hypothetical protein [Nocardioides acrostichi]MBF4160434.1 hypothetical protein [Nocardioides acrostichi]
MRPLARPAVRLALATLATLGLSAAVVAPASAHDTDRERIARLAAIDPVTDTLVTGGAISHLSTNPTQAGISGCFLQTAALFVSSGIDSLRVWDVSDPARPQLTGVLPQALFENEAMNCGERRTQQGVRRFALVGVDLVQASPGDISHVNVGGGELVIVEVTDPSAPKIVGRAEGTTSTHTVACVDGTNCRYAYSAGGRDSFSVFDLRDLDHPVEVDSDPGTPGVQPYASPTGGHKWNVDAAGVATHTGWNGASMWDTSRPRHPKLLATTGRAGKGLDPKHEGWNDFILHNSFRPNARTFKANAKPRLSNGNILLVTEEDYEQTDCARAGSFQTWWVKNLTGRRGSIKPLDKVELADLGNYPLPQGAFCSSHWFDYHQSGLVAAGFYGGGTQILDVRHPRNIRPYAHALWGASEVWDAMWVPKYRADGTMTRSKTNVVLSIDLVRGLDVYAVDVPGDDRGAVPPASPEQAGTLEGSALPLGLVALAALAGLALRRRRVA